MHPEDIDKISFTVNCNENHCFFYSQIHRDCIFTDKTLGQIKELATKYKLNINLFLNNSNCPTDAKAIIHEYKMGQLLFGKS